MAGIFLAKRTTTTIYRASVLKDDHGFPGPFFFSSAYERGQFVADTAKEGVKKATEVADSVGDAANSNGNEIGEFVDEMQNIDGPVDTVEYRNMEDNFEELKNNQDEAN